MSSFSPSAPTALLLDEDDGDDIDAPLPDECRLNGLALRDLHVGLHPACQADPLGRRALANLIDWQRRDSAADSSWRTLQFTPLSFDVHYQEFFSTWSSGGTLVLVDEGARDLIRGPCSRRSSEERIASRLHAAPGPSKAWPTSPVPRRQFPACSVRNRHGRRTVADHAARGRFFSELPECSLRNHYGPSETHVVTAYTLPADPSVSVFVLTPIESAAARNRTEGRRRTRRPRQPGSTAGELHIGGVPLSEGYFNRPELTAERFVTVDGKRFYRTGDQVRLRADGNYEFLGRLDDQVKIRGNRVELREIEVRLLEHPAVANCAVSLHGSRGVDPGSVSSAIGLRGRKRRRRPPSCASSSPIGFPTTWSRRNSSGFHRCRNRPAESSIGGLSPRPPARARTGTASTWPHAIRLERGRGGQSGPSCWARRGVGFSDNFFEFGGDSGARRPPHGVRRAGTGPRSADGGLLSRPDDRTSRRSDHWSFPATFRNPR